MIGRTMRHHRRDESELLWCERT